MKLEKAKKIIDLNIKEAGKLMPPDTLQALKIHAEALNRIVDWRCGKVLNPDLLLPGETDEPDSPQSLGYDPDL